MAAWRTVPAEHSQLPSQSISAGTAAAGGVIAAEGVTRIVVPPRLSAIGVSLSWKKQGQRLRLCQLEIETTEKKCRDKMENDNNNIQTSPKKAVTMKTHTKRIHMRLDRSFAARGGADSGSDAVHGTLCCGV